MDPTSKRHTVERYLKGAKKQRGREEEKQLKQKSRQRKASQRDRVRRATEEFGEDDATFEKIPVNRDRSPGGVRETKGPSTEGGNAPVLGATEELATVVGIARSQVEVRGDRGERAATLASAMRSSRSTLAVGDEVVVAERDDGSLEVRAAMPRRSWIGRTDPAVPERDRILAANVDFAVIVLAAARPDPRPRLIDRALIAVQRGGVGAVVCLNKVDLVDGAGVANLDALLDDYRAIGIPALLCSAERGDGVVELRRLLQGKTAVFLGHSGVGKSSLQNSIDPDGARRVGGVREGDGKGRHTTTSSMMIECADGTRLIDTPGIRAFGLGDLDHALLREAFPEFGAAREACRFRDCTHHHEPDCAVRRAVEGGSVSATRYDSYLRLLGSMESQ